jgi:dinuclear metal center YbgI/SA1388 family protein
MKIKDVIQFLDEIAPPALQESYDNSGLIVGDANAQCTGILVCLDSIEEVIEEAIQKGCNMVVAHHPIVFSGLKKITGRNYIERTIIKAIKNDIAIFAIHTNLDNVKHGVNGVWAGALNLINQKILSPKASLLKKLVVFVPEADKENVLNAMFEAGAGKIGNYSECSFSGDGLGSFKPMEDANPYVGEIGKRKLEEESRVEVLVESFRVSQIVNAMKKAHPYEEVAYDLIDLNNSHKEIGAGMIGELSESVDALEWLKSMKQVMGAESVRYTNLSKSKIKKVAICGGSGSFVLNDAIRNGADILVTADFKYHQFFDAENKIIIADIGHYESEHLTINYLASILKEKFTTFAVLLTKVNTNPINYL